MEEYKKLINSLSKQKFDLFIKEYLKVKYAANTVRIIDGPYDNGNDAEIVINNKDDIRKNIQITVQKSDIKSKLELDLQKSNANVTQHKYQKNLDFYVTQNISKKKRNEFETNAEKDFDITLKIYDATVLSEDISDSKYLPVVNILYKAHGINRHEDVTKIDKTTKMFFDVLLLNKEAIEIKKRFLHSFIFTFLYNNPDSSLDEIYDKINPQFNNKLEKKHLEKELNFLRLNNKILSPSHDKKIFKLYDEIKLSIDEINEKTIICENEIKQLLSDFINNNSIDCTPDELIYLIKSLYNENYNIDISEITHEASSNSIGTLRQFYNKISDYFISKHIDHDKSNELTKQLMNSFNQNEYLNKISATILFTNLYNLDKLDDYINNNKKHLLIDTQILLRLLCIESISKANDFNDLINKTIVSFIEAIKRHKKTIVLYTTIDYIEEVTNHLLEAFKLKHFLELPIASRLGKSNNIFYNFYEQLRVRNLIDVEDFEDFIKEYFSLNFEDINNSKFVEIFECLNFIITTPSYYEEFQIIKKDYVTQFQRDFKKSNIAVDNDVKAVLYLANNENKDINENENMHLITLDSSLYNLRKIILNNNQKKYKYWYIYSPGKFTESISVMNLSIDPKSLNYNIISLSEINSREKSLIDVISSIFNSNSNLNIIGKILSLRDDDKEIEKIEEPREKYPDDNFVTTFFINIRDYYCGKSKYSISDLTTLFENNLFEDKIVDLFKKSISEIRLTTQLSETFFNEFDKLIKENRNEL